MKNAAVMRATLVPYLPFLPSRNMAIARGDNMSDKNMRIIPPSNTHSDKSESSSKARFIAPPKITANTPDTPDIRLQNEDEDKVVLRTSKYFSSFESGC